MIRYLAAIGLVVAVWLHGSYYGAVGERVIWQNNLKVATDKARQTEKAKQEKINEILQAQYDGIYTINANLVNDIDKLRSRPTRLSMPRNTSANCAGATGRELSRPDAGFLIGEAARADRLRDALTACYAAFDSI